MYFPDNAHVARPSISQEDSDVISERLTACLKAIQERDFVEFWGSVFEDMNAPKAKLARN